MSKDYQSKHDDFLQEVSRQWFNVKDTGSKGSVQIYADDGLWLIVDRLVSEERLKERSQILDELKSNIIEENYDEINKTYDFDGIAEDLIEWIASKRQQPTSDVSATRHDAQHVSEYRDSDTPAPSKPNGETR